MPTARATQDLDLFLNMEIWTRPEKGKAVRAMLNDLGYAVLPNYQNLQFGKQPDPVTGRLQVKIDLHARPPTAGEDVAFDERRVGKGMGKRIEGKKDDGVGLHGRTTPEAFAVDDLPTRIRVAGEQTNGVAVETTVLVPHPYASINMKIKAAHDWLRSGTMRKPYSEKHVFDVYLLVAMMIATEYEECQTLAAQYADHPMSQENRRNASDLFADPGERGSVEIQRQIGDLPYDYATFWDALQGVLGAV